METKLSRIIDTVGPAVAVAATYGCFFKAGDVFARDIRITLTKKASGWKITSLD